MKINQLNILFEWCTKKWHTLAKQKYQTKTLTFGKSEVQMLGK